MNIYKLTIPIICIAALLLRGCKESAKKVAGSREKVTIAVAEIVFSTLLIIAES
ncbi:MAG: hypothetical protein QMD44_08905 [Thermodesulfovibrionales bacterium]|jgi:hypothetical protein|nr:hypothetical protein [Thermodesulfovibrionales bacterium]